MFTCFLLCPLITCSDIRRVCSKLDWYWGRQYAWKSDVILTAKLREYFTVTSQVIGWGRIVTNNQLSDLDLLFIIYSLSLSHCIIFKFKDFYKKIFTIKLIILQGDYRKTYQHLLLLLRDTMLKRASIILLHAREYARLFWSRRSIRWSANHPPLTLVQSI